MGVSPFLFCTAISIQPTAHRLDRSKINPSKVSPIRMTTLRVISGGQTGVDQGALLAAKSLGIPTGGWAPREFQTETGKDPVLLAVHFGLKDSGLDYVGRTRLNAKEADVTFWIGKDDSRGYMATLRECRNANKPFINITEWSVARLMEFINGHPEYKTLNFAGNRESSSPGIQESSRQFIALALAPFALSKEVTT